MVINTFVLYASSFGFLREGKAAAMEGLSLAEKNNNEVVEESKGSENVAQDASVTELINCDIDYNEINVNCKEI
ncbi:hypothetical protein E2542_SST26146 [Spatholobus suberectus]|nr:hypothetical protein E2542_SST26146 [Spatholobus suberectus]